MKGYATTDVARVAGVSRSLAYRVVVGYERNRICEDAVAELLGKPVEKLFKHRRAAPHPGCVASAPPPEGAGGRKKRGRPRKAGEVKGVEA
jgi:hypothetical protein